MKHLPTYLIVWLVLLGSSASAQTAKYWEKLGDKSVEGRDYYGAAHYFEKASKLDTADLDLMMKWGDAVRQSQDYKKGEEVYAHVYGTDQGDRHPEALYWLAEMQKHNGRYSAASSNYKKFTRIYRERTNPIYRKAKQEIKSCAFALSLTVDTSRFDFSMMEEGVNSVDGEYSPVLLNDTTLAFATKRYPKVNADNSVKDSLYLIRLHGATLQDGQWEDNGWLDSTINLPGFDVGNPSLSPDSSRLYFSVCDQMGKCKIYAADRVADEWGAPIPLEEPINLEDGGFTSTQPMVAMMSGKETLFFVSNRPKSKGGLDIWYSQKDRRGNFSKVRNAGSKVNSKVDDISPYYLTSEQTLYFSSPWHFGLGGFDVFKSKGTRSFAAAQNLGKPFNSSAHDFYYRWYPEANRGFLVSNRPGGLMSNGTCCNDIYEFRIPEEVVTDTLTIEEEEEITFAQLNSYLPVTLYFHNDEPNPRSRDTTTNVSYPQSLRKYMGLQPQYINEYSLGLKKKEANRAKADMEAFFADEINQGLDDLKLFAELLLVELKKGRKIQLAIKGYASPLAKSDYNLNLTKRRIASIINYLRQYEDGAYTAYLNGTAEDGGALELFQIPFGEDQSQEGVSDNLNDKRNSVYSIRAANERKIVILEVNNLAEAERPTLKFDYLTHDLDSILRTQTQSFSFPFTNTSDQPVVISTAKAACGCDVADWPKQPIEPGATGEIKVKFDPRGKVGKHRSSITVAFTGAADPIVLRYSAYVRPDSKE